MTCLSSYIVHGKTRSMKSLCKMQEMTVLATLGKTQRFPHSTILTSCTIQMSLVAMNLSIIL